MLKRLYMWLYTTAFYLFSGLRAADKVAFAAKDTSGNGDGANIEVQNEEKSVYKDLLRGEITQEVRELRHEMYYAERESHKYKYVGNGVAVKKNKLFDDEVKGLENSDGYKVQLIQNHREDTEGVADNLVEHDYRLKDQRNYTIKIERNFIPRFRIEEFANKVVVKRIDEKHVLLDVYVTKYESQFNRRHKPFLNELEAVYMGDTQSDIIDFDTLAFTTFKAYGADDLIYYKYNNIKFDNIVEFNGDYVLKFFADIECDGDDLINEFYDEIAAKKNAEHAPRKDKNTINILDVVKVEPEYNVDEAEKLINFYKENN